MVSQGLFANDSIEVYGLPWLHGEKKVVGLSSLTAKILCKKHNYDLSDVDEGGIKAFETFREMRRLGNVRGKLDPRLLPVAKYQLNGILSERWFIKTLINLAFNGEYPVGQSTIEAGEDIPRIGSDYIWIQAICFAKRLVLCFSPGAKNILV
jgi:hypothetical protein